MPSRERVAAFIASVVGGDHVRAIADYYHEDPRRLNELALQRWAGDRIAEERFVYDSASAWTVVEPPP